MRLTRRQHGVTAASTRYACEACGALNTEAAWKIDLHNLMHFLRLRLDPHAQAEIREYASAILDLIEDLFPLTMEAFQDYRLNSMQLTALDIMAIQRSDWFGETFLNDRERKEYLAKIETLGIGPLLD